MEHAEMAIDVTTTGVMITAVMTGAIIGEMTLVVTNATITDAAIDEIVTVVVPMLWILMNVDPAARPEAVPHGRLLGRARETRVGHRPQQTPAAVEAQHDL